MAMAADCGTGAEEEDKNCLVNSLFADQQSSDGRANPSCSGDISAPGRSFLHTARSKPYQVRYRLHLSMRAVRCFTAL